mgnify:CR=1 FL=1
MSNLSDLLPAGGGQNNTDFVADGTIVSGKPVILTAAGKVAPIAMASSTAGTPVVYETAAADHTTAVFDSDSNKVVIAYRDEGNSDHGTAVVGTVSGTTISYGTPVVFEAAASSWTVAVFDSNSNKVVIAYRDEGNSNYGTAIVGTVSGTSISFGTPVVFNSANSYYMGGTFDSSNNKVVIAYSDGTMKAIVATVSGTSVSFGTAVQFDAASTTKRPSAAFDSNAGKVVIAWGDNVSAAGTAIVGTVSGTAISFGTEVGFEAGGTYFTATIFDSNAGKVVIAYSDGGNSYYATAIVGTVSGTTISFGTAVVFDESWDEWFSAAFDSNANQTIISYKDGGNSNYGTAINGTVSGTAISFGTAVVFETSSIKETATVFDSNSNKVVIAYEDVGNSSYGTGVVYSTGSSNLTATNLLGVASAAIADTATGTINTWGSRNEVQTGLTIASDYYVQTDGTITTASASPAQLIGTAISATQINIKDYTG